MSNRERIVWSLQASLQAQVGYSNFSKKECQCMRLLANDRNIVTKKAGKGSCVGFWDYEDYIA